MDPSTEKLINQFLRELVGKDDISDLKYDAEFIKSDGYCSEIVKLLVHSPRTTKADGQSITLDNQQFVVKIPARSIVYEQLQNTGMFEKEIYMYEKILPRMNELIGRPRDDPYFGPRYWGTEDKYTIIMEDLRGQGYFAFPIDAVMDVHSLRQSLEKLAEFHAASVKLDELQEPGINVRMTAEFTPGAVATPKQLVRRLESALRMYLPTFETNYRRQFDTWKVSYMKQVFEDIDPRTSNFNVLNHGDMQLHNILVQRVPNATDKLVQNLKFIDFQLCVWNNPVVDIIYLLMTSTTYDTYAEYGDDILAHYLNSLQWTMKRLKCKRRHQFTVQDLKDSIKKRSTFGLLVTSFWLSLFRAEDQRKSVNFDDEESLKVKTFQEVAVPWLKFLVEHVGALQRVHS